MVLPCLPRLPPPLFLTGGEGTCTEWTAHNCFGAAQITISLHYLGREQAHRQAQAHTAAQKHSPQIFILLDSPCIIKMKSL